MQSSAGKEIEIRAALSSDYGPSPNTGQSFVEKLGQNSDRLLTNFEIPNKRSSSFVFGIFTKSTRYLFAVVGKMENLFPSSCV